jgi:hypothetical protein
MAEPILDKASYSLVRTNPKLTGNVKLVTNGEELYLESFSANSELSSSQFKAFKIDGSSTYDRDVFNFFKKGKFPISSAYEVFQEFNDSSVLSSYSNQYEMFYSYGTRSVSADSYKEDLGILAPIWLNQQIPNYFVVFKVKDPASINNVNSLIETAGEGDAQSSKKFNEFILENCTAVKTFDLSGTSKLGDYIRRYRNQNDFPKAPLTVSWKKDEPILWNGISYKNGGFTSAGNFSYDSLITNDATVIQNEYFFTKGFERNGVLLANIINLEFLFSDTSAADYSINRYFGLYVDEVTEGSFKLSGKNFYKNSEKSQLPKIKTVQEVSEFLNSEFNISNNNGVVLYLDEESVSTVTGIPTPKRVNEVESIFYVKDKKKQFHTVKKGSVWGKNQIRLFDTKIDISLLAGFNSVTSFAEAEIIERLGKNTAFFNIIGEFPDGASITFYDGAPNVNIVNGTDANKIGQISANVELTNGPGTHFERFFNPKGTPQEIAKAIINAIKNGISKDNQFFIPTINNSTVYLESKFAGTNSKQLQFTIDWVDYPELQNSIISYPETNNENTIGKFVGATNKKNSLLIVENGVEERFIKGSYVKTKAGFALVSDNVPYLEELIFAANGSQVGYRNVDKFIIISVEDNQIEISKSGQIALFTPFLPSFGRFSFYPIKDLDFDFYSERYGNLGELSKEINHYSESPTGEWPDIKDFYSESGFFNLIGLLNSIDLSLQNDAIIKSEYERLEENFLKEQAIASRIIPYINKWSWFNGGTDVRNNPYRLNVNPAFGINNFAPSKWNANRSPDGFSHEWYYLCEFPQYFDRDAIENSWSYFQAAPRDEIGERTFQRTDKNMFDEYFIADRFKLDNEIDLIPIKPEVGDIFTIIDPETSTQVSYEVLIGDTQEDVVNALFEEIEINLIDNNILPWAAFNISIVDLSFYGKAIRVFGDDAQRLIVELNQSTGSGSSFIKLNSIVEIDKQLRFGRFSGGNSQNFAEAFLRGVRIIAKTKSSGEERPNFNAKKLSYIRDGKFNEYRFSVMLVPNADNKPDNQIKIIKNNKWKTIVMLIFVSFDNVCLNPTGNSVDRTSLYSVNSDLETITGCSIETNTDGSADISYKDSKMQGAISFSSSSYSSALNQFVIQGIPDINGVLPSFFTDITIGENGQFNDIRFEFGNDVYRIKEITKIASSNRLFAKAITRNDQPFTPSPAISDFLLRSVDYFVEGGGFNKYTSILNKISFANIFEAVNQGDPNIIYETIDVAGNSVLNSDGTLAQTFAIELRAQDDIIKSSYIGVLPDPNKPTIFNLIDVIGYDLSLQTTPKIIPIARHAGSYEPLSNYIIFFRDPYGELVLDGSEDDFTYKDKVFNLCRYKNTQFYSSHKNFGILHNFFYHKVNEEDPSSILELSKDGAFLSLYPLINEIGIDRKDYYVFSSSWEPGYFTKSIDKTKKESIIGTKSMREKKAFFASKYLKVPQKIVLDTFKPSEFLQDAIKDTGLVEGTFMHNETPNLAEFYLLIQKRIIDHLSEFIKPVFIKYINPKFGIGDTTTINDDVKEYIEQNILKLYKVDQVNFYVKKDRKEVEPIYLTAELTNSEKEIRGLRIDKNISVKTLNTNLFDLKLIYNKISGFSNSYGFSITLLKK